MKSVPNTKGIQEVMYAESSVFGDTRQALYAIDSNFILVYGKCISLKK